MGYTHFDKPVGVTGAYVGAYGSEVEIANATGQIRQSGTAITADASEINVLDGVTAGTAAASKAAVLGTNKNLDTLVIADGGLKLGAGAGTAVTSTAAELNLVDNADRVVKVAKIALAAVDSAGGLFAWQNDEGAAILVQKVLLDVTTQTSGACTVDVGTTAVNATTLSDTLIDGISVASAAGLYDNITDKGTNGKSRQKLADGKWVTGSVASGASAGIVGFAYIEYVVI